MARSRTGSGRRATPAGARDLPARPGAGPSSPRPSLDSAILPRVWQGIGYRPLPDASVARPLFDYAAVPWPDAAPTLAWGAWAPGSDDERLVGVLLGERSSTAFMLHGPVVVSAEDAVEVATQLVAAALDHAAALGAARVFTRPLGLDRVWVRFGFIPVPESELPSGLGGRPGHGLYAWLGGTALWTTREPASA